MGMWWWRITSRILIEGFMTISVRRTKEYLAREKVECPGCHRKRRDVRLRMVKDKRVGKVVFKTRCNACVAVAF